MAGFPSGTAWCLADCKGSVGHSQQILVGHMGGIQTNPLRQTPSYDENPLQQNPLYDETTASKLTRTNPLRQTPHSTEPPDPPFL